MCERGLLSRGATQVLCGPRKPTVSLRFLVASIKYMPRGNQRERGLVLAHTVHHGGKGEAEKACPEPPHLLRSRQDREQRDDRPYPAGILLFLFELSPGLQSMGGCCPHLGQVLTLDSPFCALWEGLSGGPKGVLSNALGVS